MGEAPDGSIVITPKEFYDGVRQDVSDIKTALAPLDQLTRDVADLRRRVSALETRVLVASGFAMAVGMAAGWLIPHLLK
ncbi:hypothetical protein [Kribbella sp. NBC_00889]|uniref:hypothetical protein n=1 Tax=Kribbella sp. NBC_00889 TaxID=2975974 RepID=UPI003866EDB4|nr:hypothetical protein OG817_22175 [Kribbella sp. NBC_00889]